MSKMKHTLCYMAALVGFAACTQDELTGDTGRSGYTCYGGGYVGWQ